MKRFSFDFVAAGVVFLAVIIVPLVVTTVLTPSSSDTALAAPAAHSETCYWDWDPALQIPVEICNHTPHTPVPTHDPCDDLYRNRDLCDGSTDTPVPDPTNTPVPPPTNTPVPPPTNTPVPTPTNTPVPTPTNTPVPPPTNTPRPTATNTPRPTATPTPIPPLGAPTDLRATAGDGYIALSWRSAQNAQRYDVQRLDIDCSGLRRGAPENGGDDDGVQRSCTESWVGVTSTTGTSVTMSGLAPGPYTHLVRSYRSIQGSDEYAYSSAISRTVPEPALSDIGLSGSSGDGRITLSWTRDPNADGYEIKQLEVVGCGRNTPPGRAVTKCDSWFTEATITNSQTTSHVVSSLTSGEIYNHRARSFRGSGSSREYGPYSFDSTEVVGVAPTSTPTATATPTVTPTATPTPTPTPTPTATPIPTLSLPPVVGKPAAPTVVRAEARAEDSIAISWRPVSGALRYEVWYTSAGIEESGTVPASALVDGWIKATSNVTGSNYTFTDASRLICGETYAFRVYAVNAAGRSDASDPDSATTDNCPELPGPERLHKGCFLIRGIDHGDADSEYTNFRGARTRDNVYHAARSLVHRGIEASGAILTFLAGIYDSEGIATSDTSVCLMALVASKSTSAVTGTASGRFTSTWANPTVMTGSKPCSTTDCLWQSDPIKDTRQLGSVVSLVGTFYVCGQHRITSGGETVTIRTAGGAYSEFFVYPPARSCT